MPTTTVKVEVEFVAGTWTDITADVDYQSGVSVRVGRTSPQQAPQVSSLSFSLRNPTGVYTPGLQVLSDGTAAPYFPNVMPRKRVRFSNSAGVRFLGFVQSWSPVLDNGVAGRCQVQAVDRLDQLSRVSMQTPIAQEVTPDAPAAYYPLTDSGSTAADMSGKGQAALTVQGSGPAVTFGSVGPGYGDGTGVQFAPTGASTGQYIGGQLSGIGWTNLTAEVWVRLTLPLPSWASTGEAALSIGNDGNNSGAINLNNGIPGVIWNSTGVNASASIADNGWHHIAFTCTTGNVVTLYVDGVSVGSSAGGTPPTSPPRQLFAGEDPSSAASGGIRRFSGYIGQIAVYPTVLSAARIAIHSKSGSGWVGETVDARIARFLSYAGLTSSDWNLDASTVTLGTYPQAKDVLSACQDMTVSEGGGSAFYVLGGAVRFTNRRFRRPATPTLTLDAVTSVDRGTFTPSLDSQNLANQVTVNRAAESGNLSTVTITDTASVATYGAYSGQDITTYTLSDADALANAQYSLSDNRAPSYRLPQISVDLLTAETSLYSALQNVQIGSRLRVTSLPPAAGPSTQVDVIVEGWTETASTTTYMVTFDTSPADSPAAGVFNDTAYGRFQGVGNTLNASITAAATTLAVATSGSNPTFTTAPGAYPLTITIDAEQITLTAPPGGSTSPQTFTGVTRGVGGTSRAAHTAAAPVAVYQPASFAL